MDIYNLINSKSISEHCRKIKHQFNTEELAVLIYRNKRLCIDEKISLYEELIRDYPDMEVIERRHCKHYDSVKDMIKEEIIRLKLLFEKLIYEEKDVVYTYIPYYTSVQEYRYEEFKNTYKSFSDIMKAVNKEIFEDNDISEFKIKRKSLVGSKNEIIAQYIVENQETKIVNIYDVNTQLNIDNIFLNMPTPFTKGDLLIADNKPFVLEWLCTETKDLKQLLEKGNYDSSDMIGNGYYINNDKICLDHCWNYDSFEFYDKEINRKLKGMERILIGISNLLKGKISLEIFLNVYEKIKMDNVNRMLNKYTKEGLKLAGLDE